MAQKMNSKVIEGSTIEEFENNLNEAHGEGWALSSQFSVAMCNTGVEVEKSYHVMVSRMVEVETKEGPTSLKKVGDKSVN